jgi:SAM-dependent methyltransferase
MIKPTEFLLKTRKILRGYFQSPKPRKPNASDVQALYTEHDYLTAYSKHTDLRVQLDPHAAVGGSWEKMGKHQFRFLKAQGLKPHHTFLDIGCGTLRGGRHFIRYLDAGNYVGMDISPKALEYAHDLVNQENLWEKTPSLILNAGKDLKFEELGGRRFDFLLAQSVFSHLKGEHISECFAHLNRVMNPGSIFFFTFFDEDSFAVKSSLKEFGYPFSFFESLAKVQGFKIEDCSPRYKHPIQRMAKLSAC